MPSKTEKQQKFFKAVMAGFVPKPKGMSWKDAGHYTKLSKKKKQEYALKTKLK